MPDLLKNNNTPEASGWTRRFTACEPRLSEAIKLYKESGFDILLVNLPSKKTGTDFIKNEEKYECRDCFDGMEEKYRIIYTRPKDWAS